MLSDVVKIGNIIYHNCRDFKHPRIKYTAYASLFILELIKGKMLFSSRDNLGQFVKVSIDNLNAWHEKNKTVFWATYVVTLIAYSYIFTSIGFTNHTFPQAWIYSYPSYRTTTEGRWFSDLLLWLLGGTGVQSSQMYISVGLHIINAIIIAEMFGADGRLATLFAAIFLSVYPANLDRYSFPGSQIMFITADTFAVLAVLILNRQKTAWKALAGAIPLIVLCLATYQPAIALASFLILAHCVLLVLRTQDDNSRSAYIFPLGRLVTAGAAMAMGMAFYYATVRMTVNLNTHIRTHVNSLSEIADQVLGSFPAFVKYFTIGSDYLPGSLQWLPLIVILFGAVSLIFVSWRIRLPSFLSVIFLVGLMPIALRSAYVINSQSFADAGRIVYPYGFALLFFLTAIGRIKRFRIIWYSVILLLIYFCLVLATQETNKAYLKMIFDTNKINRIAARIENVVPDLYAGKRPLVIVGNLSMNDGNYKNYPNTGNRAELNEETFIAYRQTEILNFYFGRDVLDSPTIEQRKSAIPGMGGRRPWPAPESIYVTDNIVVVLLEEYKPGVPITWSK